MNDLFSIYGARKSKDGKRVNITIVTGEGEKKVYGTISRKLDKDNFIAKDGKTATIKVKMLNSK